MKPTGVPTRYAFRSSRPAVLMPAAAVLVVALSSASASAEESAGPTEPSDSVASEDRADRTSDQLGVTATRTPREGVFVLSIDPESPAAKAGLCIGDFILSINGNEIESPHEFRAVVERKPGKTFHLGIWRDGREKLLEISIGRDKAADREPPEAEHPRERRSKQQRQGERRRQTERERDREPEIRFAEDDLEDKAWLGVLLQPTDRPGAIIAAVYPESPAARAGLRPGDILVRIGETSVSTAERTGEAIERLEPGKPVELVVVRDGERKAVPVRLGDLETFHERKVERGFADDSEQRSENGPAELRMLIENQRRLAVRQQRLERIVLELAREVKQLREDRLRERRDPREDRSPERDYREGI